MSGSLVNTNTIIPQCDFLDPVTKRPSRPWLIWLQNPSIVNLDIVNAISVASGGTGNSQLPANGQLLIGANGTYKVANLTPGSGVGIVNGLGSIEINNTGILSITAGSGISASSVNGNTTISNTGVLSFSGSTTGLTPTTATSGAVVLGGTLIAINGGTGQSSYTTGDLLYANSSTTLAKLADVAAGNALISGGVGVAPLWGKIGLATHVSGTLPVANGGTGSTTAGGALTNLGAAASGANSDITSLSGLTTALSILQGGTGATTASGARTNLGLGSGLSVTITTAKLTVAGTNGSMTFTNGILTAQTAAT
jgi:hypothetical protein